MMRILLLVSALTFTLTGCQQASVFEHGAQGVSDVPLLLDGREHDHFGLGTYDGEAIELPDLLASASDHDGQRVRVTGSIQAVCKKAGCWARMTTGKKELFVKMKDHAFFLPLDCEGREAVMEGQLDITETSVAELQHYAEDAGKSAEEIASITAPKREIVLTAAGVSLAKVPMGGK